MSHKTRAFIVNAEGLRGFVKLSVVSVLRSAELSGALIKATRFMHVDIESVKKTLDKEPNREECFRFIMDNYPCLVKLLLTKFGEKDRLDKYT